MPSNRTGTHPWELSFSYGRALQSSALATWAADPEDLSGAQGAFLRRAQLTASARSGHYQAAAV